MARQCIEALGGSRRRRASRAPSACRPRPRSFSGVQICSRASACSSGIGFADSATSRRPCASAPRRAAGRRGPCSRSRCEQLLGRALALAGAERLDQLLVGDLDPLGVGDGGEHRLAPQALLGVVLGISTSSLAAVAPASARTSAGSMPRCASWRSNRSSISCARAWTISSGSSIVAASAAAVDRGLAELGLGPLRDAPRRAARRSRRGARRGCRTRRRSAAKSSSSSGSFFSRTSLTVTREARAVLPASSSAR